MIEYKKEYTLKEFREIKEILDQKKEITIKGSKDEISNFEYHVLNNALNYYIFAQWNTGNVYTIMVC
jgi:hypothetical protein